MFNNHRSQDFLCKIASTQNRRSSRSGVPHRGYSMRFALRTAHQLICCCRLAAFPLVSASAELLVYISHSRREVSRRMPNHRIHFALAGIRRMHASLYFTQRIFNVKLWHSHAHSYNATFYNSRHTRLRHSRSPQQVNKYYGTHYIQNSD